MMNGGERYSRLCGTTLLIFLTPLDFAAGLHMMATFHRPLDDIAVARAANEKRVGVTPLSSYFIGRERRSGLVLGFANTSVEQMPDAVRVLRRVAELEASGA